jgi:hypothetical protein
MSEILEHDPVALLEPVEAESWPAKMPLKLPRGSVGTVVMVYNDGEAYEVEFSGTDGRAYALLTLKPELLLPLHHEAPAAVAA